MNKEKRKIAYLLGFIPNPRFDKRIKAAKSEFDTVLICWSKSSDYTFRNLDEGVSSYIINIIANPYDPVGRVIPYLRYAKKALRILKVEKPKVIHLQGLDMLLLACWYKNCFDRKVHIVYEVADLHRLLVDDQATTKLRLFAKGVAFFEKQCSRFVDKLIVTSERYFDICYKRYYKHEQVLYIPNIPSISAFKNYAPKNHNYNFTVGFIGGIRYVNEIKLLIFAAKKAGVKVFLAGLEHGKEIERLCESEDYVTYFGKYNYDTQIAYLYGCCDAIFSVYPSEMKNVQVALPNKLYESILCRLPIIVSKGTYVGDLVEQWGIGIAIDSNNESDLIKAILELLNRKKYEQFQKACDNQWKLMDLNDYLAKYIKTIRSMM